MPTATDESNGGAALRARRVMAAVIACAALLGLVACGGTSRARQATAQTGRSRPHRPPVVMFLGDSYTAGIGRTTADETYASITARQLGWQVIIAGHRGTGFVAPGRVDDTFARLYQAQLSWRPAPDMVIIAGGHNDWPYPSQMTSYMATRLLQRIKHRWPYTHVVLVGPMWGSGRPLREALDITSGLANVAKQQHVPYIDPIDEHWITGSRSSRSGNAPRYILWDNTHPSASGHEYFASRLITDLKRLGLSEPTMMRSRQQDQGNG